VGEGATGKVGVGLAGAGAEVNVGVGLVGGGAGVKVGVGRTTVTLGVGAGVLQEAAKRQRAMIKAKVLPFILHLLKF